MPVKTTDISSNLAQLAGPDAGRWGFLYSSCIPQQYQTADVKLKQSKLGQQQLGQVGEQVVTWWQLMYKAVIKPFTCAQASHK
jgi:hypothetical protein